MADAKKCDRCGKFYTNNDRQFRVNGGYPVRIDMVDRNGWTLGNGFDLCEDCMKELWHWLRNEQESESEEDE